MSLHRIYHSLDAFSTADKQGLAERITALYTAIGLPVFYTNVIFIVTEKDSFFVGGQATNKYVRIVIQHLAMHLQSNEIKKTFIEKYEKAILPFIKEKGYDWQIHIEDITNETWKLNGHTPPLPDSSQEEDWIRFKKITTYP